MKSNKMKTNIGNVMMKKWTGDDIIYKDDEMA